MCLQNQKKKKRDTKVSYIVKRRKKNQKNGNKEVHNEVSSSQDQNEGRWAKKIYIYIYICQVMC